MPQTIHQLREQITGAPTADPLGRDAEQPTQITWRGWKAVLRRTFKEMISDQISLVAAGCAFYATLSLFPAISMLVSIYGLVFDPVTVEPQLNVLRDLLPPTAFTMISGSVHGLVSQPARTLGIGLIVSVLATLWTATTGTKSMLSALNMAYEETERRGFFRFQLTALAMTLCAIIGAVVGLAILVGLPAIFSFLGGYAYVQTVIRLASMLVLVLFIVAGLALLYRYGPSRSPAKWVWITPGAVAATVLWVIASSLFSLYVGHVASYDLTYGPVGTVAGMMMWFFVTVYVVLLGAELNSELELQTARDTSAGGPAPIGRRGAYVADHVTED